MFRTLPAISLAGLLVLGACGGGGDVLSIATPTPEPPSAADCPSSGSLPQIALTGASSLSVRRGVYHSPSEVRFVPGQIAVYAADGSMHVEHVDESRIETEMSRLRATHGVREVARVTYRHRLAIANDPYYVGFTGTVAPYFETNAIPGQWDMHAIKLDGAWSQFSSSPIVAAPIAVVDTGLDVTHPEIVTPSGVTAPKVIRTQCYVTYPASAAQTSGPYVTDTDGHGTNVAGLADGDTNNNYAFAGTAFDAPILAYRVFPDRPVSGCSGNPPPAQCETSSADEASAIDDAVAHGAKVINLSLGGPPPCATNDPEYVAVEYAISNGVVVVAAAGNGNDQGIGQPFLECPAADPGVIAVGASALNDTNPLAITEYVSGYSNYLTTSGTSNAGAYLVAPGGDPCPGTFTSSCGDTDDLHWIEHIYSSTAVEPGDCGSDFAGEKGDCRILIAGTSMSAPHVAGVVSLMRAKNPNLTPAQIATGLCATADNINDAKEGCGRVNAAAAVTWASTH